MGKSEDLEMTRQSMIEELEVINRYQPRMGLVADPELKKVLQHNMDAGKKHMAILMEWLRKNDPAQDAAFGKHD